MTQIEISGDEKESALLKALKFMRDSTGYPPCCPQCKVEIKIDEGQTACHTCTPRPLAERKIGAPISIQELMAKAAERESIN